VIPRITRGSSAQAALAYDFGPGRREEHVNARTVAGNVPGTWRDQAAMIDETVAARPRVEKGIWRTSLRVAPEDRVLSDGEWGQVAEGYIAAMKLGGHPWTATRHGDDHIHLTVSRVSWSGKVASLSHDFAKAQAACRAIEVKHHLIDASARFDRLRPQVSHGERERAARLSVERAAGRTGELVAGSEREQLRELVGNATTQAAGKGREGFEENLTRTGVLFRANVASTGRVSGYSYGLAGHLDAAGEQVFFKGSQLGKAHSWAATSAMLAMNPGRSAERAFEQTPARTPDHSPAGDLEGTVAAPATSLQKPVSKPGHQPVVAQPAPADRERLLAERRAVLAQRRELTRERLSADADHRGALAVLASARRALEVASRAHRDATSQWQELARQVERTGIALAQAIAASREVSAARRAREQLAASWAVLGGRPTAAAQRQAAVQAAQDRGEAARAAEVAGRARMTQAEDGLRSAQREVAVAQEQVDQTGQVAQAAAIREQRASKQVTGWEVEQTRSVKPSSLVQQALERARGRGPGPGGVDPWRQTPGPSRGSGPSR